VSNRPTDARSPSRQIDRSAQLSKVKIMSTNSPSANISARGDFNGIAPQAQAGVLQPVATLCHGLDVTRNETTGLNQPHWPANPDTIDSAVEIFPSNAVSRRAVAWNGMAAEIIHATTHSKIELRFRGPVHLLVVCERGIRCSGETFVEGLPRSALRDQTRKLTFVPAGHDYFEWQEPRVLTRLAYFYFDPVKLPIHPDVGFADMLLAPRLFFEDPALANTALKLERLIESSDSSNQLYLEALGIVLAHEIVRLNAGTPPTEAPVRGGLAAWQQRIVIDYIEEHLSEQISLATLAQLVRLSPHYFCRAFKQSLHIAPHHYHSSRRIEHAKALLAKRSRSVTDVGLALGFKATSSFTATFRKATGLTPTGFRASLV
jgi:AraC family transcriptional regulator